MSRALDFGYSTKLKPESMFAFAVARGGVWEFRFLIWGLGFALGKRKFRVYGLGCRLRLHLHCSGMATGSWRCFARSLGTASRRLGGGQRGETAQRRQGIDLRGKNNMQAAVNYAEISS